MTLDELLELRKELQLAKDEEKAVSLPALITVEEDLYEKLLHEKSILAQTQVNIEEVRQNLIQLILHYGPYLKTVYEKDPIAAEKSYAQILKYDRGNPQAYYRLGILAYKKNNYLTAAVHFNNALRSNERRGQAPYSLSDEQKVRGYIYLSICALHLAQDSFQAVNESMGEKGAPPSISNLLEQQRLQLEEESFVVSGNKEERKISKKECELYLTSKQYEDYIILFYSDRGQLVHYQKKTVKLSIQQADLLKCFMLKNKGEKPLTKKDFLSLFSSRDERGEIPVNVITNAIHRLRKKLQQVQIPETVIQTFEAGDEVSFHFNQEQSYLVIQQIDE